MKTFATHLIFSPKDVKFIKKLKRHKDFYFDYRDDPSFSTWEEKNSESSNTLYYKPSKKDLNRYKSDYEVGKELLIVTEDIDKASNIMNLVYGGTLIFYPSLYDNKKPAFCYELKDEKVIDEYYLEQSINYRILLGCLVALNSWDDMELIYSVEKYRFSIELDHFTPHSSDPIYGQKFYNFTPSYRSHVNSGYAVFIAYSIIEELGLDIRSSSKKPRFLENDEWNPQVKDDIIKRLNKVEIKEDDYVYWLQRGEPTILQEEIKPKLGVESEYNNNREVRDLKLKVYEALHYASYIRNFFVAHKFSNITKYLSPYDIHNVQNLARFLIQSRLGLRKKSIEEIKESSPCSFGI